MNIALGKSHTGPTKRRMSAGPLLPWNDGLPRPTLTEKDCRLVDLVMTSPLIDGDLRLADYSAQKPRLSNDGFMPTFTRHPLRLVLVLITLFYSITNATAQLSDAKNEFDQCTCGCGQERDLCGPTTGKNCTCNSGQGQGDCDSAKSALLAALDAGDVWVVNGEGKQVSKEDAQKFINGMGCGDAMDAAGKFTHWSGDTGESQNAVSAGQSTAANSTRADNPGVRIIRTFNGLTDAQIENIQRLRNLRAPEDINPKDIAPLIAGSKAEQAANTGPKIGDGLTNPSLGFYDRRALLDRVLTHSGVNSPMQYDMNGKDIANAGLHTLNNNATDIADAIMAGAEGDVVKPLYVSQNALREFLDATTSDKEINLDRLQKMDGLYQQGQQLFSDKASQELAKYNEITEAMAKSGFAMTPAQVVEAENAAAYYLSQSQYDYTVADTARLNKLLMDYRIDAKQNDNGNN